jgi:superfamily II DNA or RNA helicase
MLKLDPKYHTVNGGITLSEEQIEGVEFLMNRYKAILAFQTGLGKTLVSLTALKVLLETYGKARGIIVCPVKAVKIFKKELLTRLDFRESDIGILSNQENEYNIQNNKIFIITSTALSKYHTLIPDITKNNKLILILDEAHQLQDNKSGIYILLESIKKYFSAIWFTTATPILNDLDSLYNIVGFLDKNILGSKTHFMNQYTISRLKEIYVKGGMKRKIRDVIGFKDLDKLKVRLKDICIMRQIKYNLKFGHITEKLTNSEKEIYERVSAGIMGDEERNFGQRLHDLQRLVDNSYEDEMVCALEDSTKEKMLISSLKTIMEKEYSTIIYVDYLDTVNRLETLLYERQKEIGFNNLFQIKGSVDFKVREKIEDEIGKKDIILVTRAGTESINLQKANCVVMYDIPYSIKDCIQLIGRITRMDTKYDSQYIITICTQGTIDEYKYMLFQDYAKLIKDVLGSDANLPNELQEIDRKNLQNLKDKLLWHYKDVDKKEINKKKRILKTNLITCTSSELGSHMATYFVSLNPESNPIHGTKRLNTLCPNEKDYQEYRMKILPYTVLKNRYIDTLKSPEGKLALGTLVGTILNKRSIILLVDDYGIGDILRTFILDNVILD